MELTSEQILHHDEYLVVVNKPIELPVHKNEFMPVDADYLTKLVGKFIGASVYPVHRLDAKTSGVIVLALSRDIANQLAVQFEQRQVEKKYLVIVKGEPDAEGEFDTPVVIKKKKKRQNALTRFKKLSSVATDISYKDKEVRAISLMEAAPETGRWHQIRQHFSSQRFDILGDTQHGDWTLNRIMTDKTEHKRLFLHARSLTFTHPVTNEKLTIDTGIPSDFEDVLQKMDGLNCKWVVEE